MLPLHTQKSLDKLTWNEVQKLHGSLGLKATATTRTRRDYQRRIVAAQPQPVAEPEAIATPLTCATCPFGILLEDNRYECGAAVTGSVTRGHWEAKNDCYDAVAQVEIETEAEVTEPVAEVETEMPIVTIEENVTPISTEKKLTLSLVAVKRISSDIPATNFDCTELEIAAKQSLALGGFYNPPVVKRDGEGYKIISGHFEYHAAAIARQLNPKAGETIPVFIVKADEKISTSPLVPAIIQELTARPPFGWKFYRHPSGERHLSYWIKEWEPGVKFQNLPTNIVAQYKFTAAEIQFLESEPESNLEDDGLSYDGYLESQNIREYNRTYS